MGPTLVGVAATGPRGPHGGLEVAWGLATRLHRLGSVTRPLWRHPTQGLSGGAKPGKGGGPRGLKPGRHKPSRPPRWGRDNGGNLPP